MRGGSVQVVAGGNIYGAGAMASPARHDSEEDEDSLEEVFSALVAVFGYLGLIILAVLGCIAAIVLR